jgi:hypothetical protein
MSDDSAFFHFPLELLAFGKNPKNRLGHVVDYCLSEVGRNLSKRMTGPELKEMACSVHNKPNDFSRSRTDCLEIVAAMKILEIAGGSIGETLAQSRVAREFHLQFSSRHGGSPFVRVKNDFLWDALDGRMTYREFAVIAAIYSTIGAKSYPVRITRETIQHRMLGYKSKAVMKSELASRTDGATPLSIWQIGRTVDSIAERHFFTRARKNRRQTFYSLTLRQDQLEAALMDDLQWSHGYHNRRRQRDEEFMARIQEAKSAIKVSGVL